MKNIVILTSTLERYNLINSSLSSLSQGFLRTSNTFIPLKTLAKFKRRSFYQIFFPDTHLLIIDADVFVGKNERGENIDLFYKIKILNVVNVNTKILLLTYSNFEKSSENISSFTLNEKLKDESLMPKFFSKVMDILDK